MAANNEWILVLIKHNLPNITYLPNNGGSNDMVCINYVYLLNDINGKNSWNYYCRFKGCGASISVNIGILKSGDVGPIEPNILTPISNNNTFKSRGFNIHQK